MANRTAVGSQDLSDIVKKPIRISIGGWEIADDYWLGFTLANRVQAAISCRRDRRPFNPVKNPEMSPWKVLAFNFNGTHGTLTISSV